jgi:superfamily I DNA and/or RNA helicase
MPDLLRKDSRLTVGTVHALQGAERAIVLFSPTYGENFNGGAFFDQKPNMLNVAVSRARDSFIVIGNRKVFDAGRTALPSGLLATYLVERSRETVEG